MNVIRPPLGSMCDMGHPLAPAMAYLLTEGSGGVLNNAVPRGINWRQSSVGEGQYPEILSPLVWSATGVIGGDASWGNNHMFGVEATDEFTAFAQFVCTNPAGNQTDGIFRRSSVLRPFELTVYGGDRFRVRVARSGGSWENSVVGTDFLRGDVVQGVFTSRPGSVSAYVDGRAINVDDSAPTGTLTWESWTRATNRLHIIPSATLEVQAVMLWPRALSEAEVMELYADPYEMFREPSRLWMFFDDAPPAPAFNPAWAANSNVLVGVGA